MRWVDVFALRVKDIHITFKYNRHAAAAFPPCAHSHTHTTVYVFTCLTVNTLSHRDNDHRVSREEGRYQYHCPKGQGFYFSG